MNTKNVYRYGRLLGWTVLIGCGIGALAWREVGLSPPRIDVSKDRSDRLRTELVHAFNGQNNMTTIFRLREGIERYLITDINNAGASSMGLNTERNPRRLRGETYYASRVWMPPPQPDWPPIPGRYNLNFHTEQYDTIDENTLLAVNRHPLSTFSIDVDTASYTNVRRILNAGTLPPKAAVRIEEFINYFSYAYPIPKKGTPFTVNVDVSETPWARDHLLARIGLRGYEPPASKRPPVNLIFLIDVSGSMDTPDKLPLVKDALRYLTNALSDRDRVGMVVYAGNAGEVLPPTRCDEKSAILSALDRLTAGGSTNGGQGIRLAYDMALRHFDRKAQNRVVLCTDGDFNVGITDRGELIEFIQERAKKGIFLSIYGFGMGNLKDGRLEELSNKGNGQYGFIDTFEEARRTFGKQLAGSLITIAKDVKIQVEFNPEAVSAYRLIGYENRLLDDEDFNDDTKDAGEIGAGHTVTALYELVPAGVDYDQRSVDPLRYRETVGQIEAPAHGGELMTVKVRYKEPRGEKSRLITTHVPNTRVALEETSEDLRFAAAVASFGMLLRESEYAKDSSFEDVIRLATGSIGELEVKERAEFLQLVSKAAELRAAERGRAHQEDASTAGHGADD